MLEGKTPDMIFKEAINLRHEFLSLVDLSNYERIVVWSIAKSLKDEVNFLRKEKVFDSKRLATLEERINYLKRSSLVRMESQSGDENGKTPMEIT
ncbi:hypothetical protein U1Q18_031691 [Sarracenia purpurea var. burkii]